MLDYGETQDLIIPENKMIEVTIIGLSLFQLGI